MSSNRVVRIMVIRMRRNLVTLEEWCATNDINVGTARQWRHRYGDFPPAEDTTVRPFLYAPKKLDRWWKSVRAEGRVPWPPSRGRPKS